MTESIWMLHGDNLIDLLNPDSEKMSQQIITDKLRNIRRFRDHDDALNVLQHACLVEALAAHLGEGEAVKFWSRHHDDHEAFIGDIHSGLKILIRQKTGVLDAITEKLDQAVCKLHGRAYPRYETRHIVNDLDKFARHWEWVHVMQQDPDSPGAPKMPDWSRLANISYETMMQVASDAIVRIDQENKKFATENLRSGYDPH